MMETFPFAESLVALALGAVVDAPELQPAMLRTTAAPTHGSASIRRLAMGFFFIGLSLLCGVGAGGAGDESLELGSAELRRTPAEQTVFEAGDEEFRDQGDDAHDDHRGP